MSRGRAWQRPAEMKKNRPRREPRAECHLSAPALKQHKKTAKTMALTPKMAAIQIT
ncbi:hypothetical protein psul1_p47 [Paracoccus phage vB_PsuS_Psul1]|nr:hypothetical protein psul1_p47 [Paracoccus phage vB_PsuS_Psul1]